MEKDIRLIEEIKKEYSTMDSLGEYVQALENLLTRYKQLEEENKKLEDKLSKIIKYSNWEIEAYTETILDYIDDDKIGNADFIGELKENREHWKDINKICNGEEGLYNNYYVE